MIWIFVPAYNEEQDLPALLPKIHGVLKQKVQDHRIVVVNDGSVDRTGEILNEFQKMLPLDIVTHQINRGLGETERDGFEFIAMRCSPEDVIVRVEADNTHEPSYIFDLLAKLNEGYDVVNTSRFQPGGGQIGVDGYRAFISRAANSFMHFIFRIQGTRDYSCGYRAYRAQVIQDAIGIFGNNFIQLRGLGFTSTLEMIVKLHILGARFVEVPFVLRYDQKTGYSKMIGSVTTLGYLLMALLYHWPFGGWISQYRGLRDLYRKDPKQAVEMYNSQALRRRSVSRISL
ncbi:MAG: glycosyltransferase [Chloroflexi bacterium]|nr:glycosyltransferase [Chloroflexota bacterium]